MFGPSGDLFGSSSGTGGKEGSSSLGPLFGGSFGSSQSSGQSAGSLFGSRGGGLLGEGSGLFGQSTTTQQQSSLPLGGLGNCMRPEMYEFMNQRYRRE